ncbi:PadR family transcriptional regulator [Micromonospora sp. NPDC005161]
MRRSTGLPTGTISPILDRLLDGGWLSDRWEEADTVTSRPRRRYFRLTDEGRHSTQEPLAAAEKET